MGLKSLKSQARPAVSTRAERGRRIATSTARGPPRRGLVPPTCESPMSGRAPTPLIPPRSQALRGRSARRHRQLLPAGRLHAKHRGHHTGTRRRKHEEESGQRHRLCARPAGQRLPAALAGWVHLRLVRCSLRARPRGLRGERLGGAGDHRVDRGTYPELLELMMHAHNSDRGDLVEAVAVELHRRARRKPTPRRWGLAAAATALAEARIDRLQRCA